MFRCGCFARTVKIHKLVEIQSGNSMSWYAKQQSQAVDYFPEGRCFRSMFFWLNFFLWVFSKCNFTRGLFSGDFFPQIIFPVQWIWGWHFLTSLFSELVSAVAVFKGIYSHLKNISGYRIFLFDVICFEIRHNGVAFFLIVVDEN